MTEETSMKTFAQRPKNSHAVAAQAHVIKTSAMNGHFYSPVVDPDEVRRDAARLWPQPPATQLGIDLNDAYHHFVLNELFPRFFNDFDYPETGSDDDALTFFYTRNSQFSWLDARSLFVLLRDWKPRRIVEVGSGYSTLLMSDINRRFFQGAASITAIEPYPRPFLKKMDDVALIEQRVQGVPFDPFEQLDAGDILFIDSSHVAKTGSDVNHLFFEVLPRLKRGVRVHIHDVFLPVEYPPAWVIDENRSWNEQYILRALLMFSSRWRVLFGSMNALVAHTDSLSRALGRPHEKLYGGGSFWIETI